MLISAIMPTRSRQAYAIDAVSCFRCQTYPDKELIILDDVDDPSFPDGLNVPGVVYERLQKRLTIGAKRNIAVSRSSGELIAHFDSDDYSAPERLADQIARLGDKQITGYHSMRFTDGVKWWQYTGAEDYALGTSLLYRRSYWEETPFKIDCQYGEDNYFIWRARQHGQIATVDAGAMMWARNHGNNTDPRDAMGNTAQWREILET